MASAVGCLGRGAAAKLFFAMVQQFTGEVLDFPRGVAARGPLKNGFAEGDSLRERDALLDFRIEDRNALLGRHSTDIATNDSIPYFAGNHKPTFEVRLEFLRFAGLLDCQI